MTSHFYSCARYALTTWMFLSCVSIADAIQTQETRSQNNDHQQDRFGRKPEKQFEVFVADDVSPTVQKAIEETLSVAVDTWGSSGRLEYWVLGADRKAAIKLSEEYCERRIARGHMTRNQCESDKLNKDHGFLMYQSIGEKALATGKPRGSAGHNGGAQWGFHNMTSSLPLGFAGKLNIPGEGEQITLLHEYWHSIQHSFIQTTDHKKRRELMGPVWFTEGSAVAMAETTAARLWQQKKLKKWNNSPHQFQSLKKRMLNKIKIVQEKRKTCRMVLPDSYEGDCRQLAYEGGAWAICYLMNKHGQDVLLKKFHPSVEKLGWERAFRQTFGKSSKEFEIEFSKFLDLPESEQLEILPRS